MRWIVGLLCVIGFPSLALAVLDRDYWHDPNERTQTGSASSGRAVEELLKIGEEQARHQRLEQAISAARMRPGTIIQQTYDPRSGELLPTIIEQAPAVPLRKFCPVGGEIYEASVKFCPSHGAELQPLND